MSPFAPLLVFLALALQAEVAAPVYFTGMCDASAGIALEPGLFVVANDEDNILRIYETGKGGPPIKKVDLTGFLRLDRKNAETDLEGAALLGDAIYWIGSHGRNKDGKTRPNRQRLFATRSTGTREKPDLKPVGVPCTRLLSDLLRDPRYVPFGLEAASRLAPKERGGLNIEGLAPAPEGRLLIGFRNPIPGGRALVAPLLNPKEIVEGGAAKFGDPISIDLGGLGIRDMVLEEGRYLIIAGSHGEGGEFRLYLWDGGAGPPSELKGALPQGATPEAIVFDPWSRRFLLLSDDGTSRSGGTPCKRLSDISARKFRGFPLDAGSGDPKPDRPPAVH